MKIHIVEKIIEVIIEFQSKELDISPKFEMIRIGE